MKPWITWTPTRVVIRCLAIILTVLPGLSQAEVILSDDFEGAEDIQNVSTITSKATWESSQDRASLSIVMDQEGMNSGRVFSLGAGIVFVRLPAMNLEVGSTLTLSLRFRSLDEKAEFLGPLRIGLCDNRDDGLPDSGDTVGYWAILGPGADVKSGVSIEHNSESLIGGGNDATNIGEGFVLGFDWLKPHRLTFKIVRSSENSIEIHTQIDDGQDVIRTDAKASLTRFNLIAIRLANAPTSQVFIDDVKLELTKK